MSERLLTDPEIVDALGGEAEHQEIARARNVAQAQDKKTHQKDVEWGEEFCEEHYAPRYLPKKRKSCNACWQAFKEG